MLYCNDQIFYPWNIDLFLLPEYQETSFHPPLLLHRQDHVLALLPYVKGLEGLDAEERRAVLLSVLTYESQQSPSCCCVWLHKEPVGASVLSSLFIHFPQLTVLSSATNTRAEEAFRCVAMEKPLSLCQRFPSSGHTGPPTPLSALQPHLSASRPPSFSLFIFPYSIQYANLHSVYMFLQLVYKK